VSSSLIEPTELESHLEDPQQIMRLWFTTIPINAPLKASLCSTRFSRVRGHPGFWSEWGNLTDTPVEFNRVTQ
jgi:ABC-type Fe2+-enterobactin transport system substrate-binding protein